MTASTKKRESVGIGKKGLESALDEAAAERRQRALVAQAEEDVGLRHAIEIRNLTAEESEKFAPGVEQVAAEKLLSAAERAALGDGQQELAAPGGAIATQPRLARPAPTSESDDRSTQPRANPRPALRAGLAAASSDAPDDTNGSDAVGLDAAGAGAPSPAQPGPTRGLFLLAVAALLALFGVIYVWITHTPDTAQPAPSALPRDVSAAQPNPPAGSSPTVSAFTPTPTSASTAEPSATHTPSAPATATTAPNSAKTNSTPSAKPSAKPNVGSEWTDWKLDPAPKPK